jgi:hypothetical protein
MKNHFFILIFPLFFIQIIQGQNYRYTLYNTETGSLPQNQAGAIFQDSKGNIWIGTRLGISKFDGETFKIYGKEEGVLQGNISFICELKPGEITMFSFNNGISVIKSDKVKSHKFPGTFRSISVAKIKDSLIIVAGNYENSESVLYSFKEGKYKLLKKYHENLRQPIFANDTLWILSCHNILTGKLGYFDKDYNVEKLVPEMVCRSALSWKDSIYIVSGTALFRYYSGEIKNIIANRNITEIFLNSSGIFINESQVTKIPNHYDFSGKWIDSYHLLNVAAILFDKEKNYWFGTEDGLYKLSEKAFKHYVFKDFGIAPNNPGLVIAKNQIWISSLLGNLYQLKNNRFIDFTYKIPHKGFSFLISHAVKPDGTILWGGDEAGAIIQKDEHFMMKKYSFGSPFYAIYNDTLLNHTLLGYLGLRIENHRGEVIADYPGLSRIITDIEKDTSGNYFLAQRRIIQKFKNGKFNEYPIMALVIEHDARHNLWFGGEDGLYLYNNKDFKKIEHPVFNHKAISALHPVGDSVLLIGTTMGLIAMDLRAFYNKSKIIVKYYNAENGFSGNECSQNSFAEDENGYVWIPVNDRLIQIDPRKLNFSNIPVEPYIQSMSTMENAVWQTHDTTIQLLSHSANSIKFEFSGPYFSNPVTYAYYLEGYEKEWSEYGNVREATYTNLPPGRYTFYVKAANGDETDNILKTAYRFTIRPAIWQTTWFKVAFILIAVLAIVLIIRLLSNIKSQIQRKNFEQNRLMVQTQLSQLDPHFIFNTLTTTGTFALRLKQVGIYDIIVQFSQLLRRHWVDKKLTRTLGEELAFIDEYCALNRINHAERFDYSINIATGVDTSVKVIKLFIQNFVENAMKHGIENIKEHGQIIVDLMQDNTYTYIIIDDNGIGYNEARKLNTGRKGTGMKVLSETIALYNSWNKKEISYLLRDKSEISPDLRGTSVEIKIPNDYDYRDN